MSTLKETITELQTDLAREKEFNASSKRINQEYLVNVLKQFLLTDNISERAQLVGPITSLLHLRPEDARLIIDKWAVSSAKAGGGLLSWVLPARPGPGGGGGSGGAAGGGSGGKPFDAFSDGLGSLHAYS
jgi:hypothetical protein